MASENKILLMGNLTRDPELRYTPGGQAVAAFTVAVNRRYKNNTTGETVDKADFIPVEVWRKQAESCKQYLLKGSSVYVEGRLQSDSWEANDGTKRSKLKVVAQRVQFLTRSPRAKNEEENSLNSESFEPNAVGLEDEDVPF
ncbi:MAG: single-stranded DNA-binding protein [bacterium]